jgi:hypothetical protein
MSAVESDGRYQRDAALLQGARTIAANKSFVLLFAICALVGAVGLLVVAVSGLWGWITVAALLVIGGAGVFSGKMDELMTLGVATIAGLTGILSVIVTAYVILGIRHWRRACRRPRDRARAPRGSWTSTLRSGRWVRGAFALRSPIAGASGARRTAAISRSSPPAASRLCSLTLIRSASRRTSSPSPGPVPQRS